MADGATCAIGVDFGGTKIEAILLDAAGVERWRERIASPRGDYDASLQAVAGLVGRARQAAGGARCTIGIGAPGNVTQRGVMKNGNSTQLNNRPLPHDLEVLLGQPVRVTNDANCLALSEATDGAGAGAEVVFAGILGTGVGAGIAVRGRVLNGPNGLAGEWGHNPLPWAEPGELRWRCFCGQLGCIETLVSGTGLARDHACVNGGTLDARQVAQRAAQGDAACEATMQRWESRLARALAHVINLLDPDVIVLGGGLSRIERLYASVPALLPRWVFAGGVRDEPVRTPIVPSLHGDSSGVRGAAWLWRE
ncbi:MAG TPA: ROK family protein [Burkholderiaceae bacterium]|nr:ROK family protein [Burkholderiaceae bacterium]